MRPSFLSVWPLCVREANVKLFRLLDGSLRWAFVRGSGSTFGRAFSRVATSDNLISGKGCGLLVNEPILLSGVYLVKIFGFLLCYRPRDKELHFTE